MKPMPSGPQRRILPGVRRGHLIGLIEARLGSNLFVRAIAEDDEDQIFVEREHLLRLIEFLRSDPDADLTLLVDITAIDFAGSTRAREDGSPLASPAMVVQAMALPDHRFEVVYRLRSPRLGYRVSVRVSVSGTDPVVPSLTAMFRGADWLERELWDLFGIYADGHPYLRRLLLYSGFEGHPLRKDYPTEKSQPLVPLRRGPHPADRVPPCDPRTTDEDP